MTRLTVLLKLASSHARNACEEALPIFLGKMYSPLFIFSIDIKCSPLFLFFLIKSVILNNIIIHDKLFLIL
jgi:hypothetical protein